MRLAALTALVGVLMLFGVAAELPSPVIEFTTPIQMTGALHAQGSTVLVLVFREAAPSLEIEFLDGITVSETRRNTIDYYVEVASEGNPTADNSALDPEDYAVSGPVRMTLSPRSPSSLLVQADQIEFGAHSAAGTLDAMFAGGCISHGLADQELDDHLYVPGPGDCSAGPIIINRLGTEASSVSSVQVAGLRRATWHNMDVTCDQTSCPSGGMRDHNSTSPHPFVAAGTSTYGYVTAVGDGRIAIANTTPDAIVGLGPTMTLMVNGSVRMPRASGTCGADCSLDGEGTLLVEGAIVLAGLHPTSSGRASAILVGTITAARLDENTLAELISQPEVAIATAAVILVGAAVAKVLLALFHRRPKNALEHPSRRRAYEAILERPGLTIRKLAARTGIPFTTVRFHLTVLERAGAVMARPFGRSRLYFENHGKFGDRWRQVAVVLDEPFAALISLVAKLPGASQNELLGAAAAQWGWRRSTTAYRLQGLVRCGAVQQKRVGRHVTYIEVTDPAPQQSQGPPSFAQHAGPVGD